MTDVLSTAPGTTTPETPSAQLRARLDDPEVASALADLLDNAPLLALLAQAVSGLLSRGDVITDNVASAINEMRSAAGSGPTYLIEPTRKLAENAPGIADAAVEGVQAAERNRTSLDGIRSGIRALRDPDVARGMGVMIEVARAIGRIV